MLTGSIVIHEQPKTIAYNSEEYWDNYMQSAPKFSTEQSAQVLAEIEKAKEMGFFIGQAVRRKSFSQHIVGEIIGFSEAESRVHLYKGKYTVISVKWPDAAYTTMYNVEELEIVK